MNELLGLTPPSSDTSPSARRKKPRLWRLVRRASVVAGVLIGLSAVAVSAKLGGRGPSSVVTEERWPEDSIHA